MIHIFWLFLQRIMQEQVHFLRKSFLLYVKNDDITEIGVKKTETER